MKRIILAGALLFSLFAAEAQQLRTPQPSTTTTIKQDFGLSNIELVYSRPNAKGRKIFGDLVPFDAVWRTGANQATILTFGEEVIINGTKVPAGKYGLLTIPGKAEWTFILTKQLDVTSPTAYKADQDVVRVKATPKSLPMMVETFTIQFANVLASSCDVRLVWENLYVDMPVKVDVESKVMAQIDNVMNKDTKPYFGAAMYYMDNGKDLNKALGWFDKAIEQNPQAYWVWHQKANCLAKLGKKQDAITTAQKSMELAKAGGNPDYVTLNEKLIATLK